MHPSLSKLYPDITELAKELSSFAHYHLEVHRPNYNDVISSKRFKHIYTALKEKEIPSSIEQLNHSEEIHAIHKNIQNLALLCHGLTVIKRKVWLSDEWIHTKSLSDEKMTELIISNNLQKILLQEDITPKKITLKIHEIMDSIFSALSEEEVVLLKSMLSQENPGNQLFHENIVNRIIRNGSVGKTVLKFFKSRILEIRESLLTVTAAMETVAPSEEIPAHALPLPFIMKSGGETKK